MAWSACSACAGCVFYLSSTAQTLVRPGFDISIHPLSQLATGGPGWIQRARSCWRDREGSPSRWRTAASVSFLALAGACITLLVRSVRHRRVWASAGHGLVATVLLLPISPTHASSQVAVTGLFAFAWVTVVALRLRHEA